MTPMSITHRPLFVDAGNRGRFITGGALSSVNPASAARSAPNSAPAFPIKLYAMAHSKQDAEKALKAGAEGIGLARTEIMYQTPERAAWLSSALSANTEAERKPFLDKLEDATRREVAGMLQVLKGKPLTVRLLDPSLSEILPPRQFHESNPLLGLRGVRLGIVYPDVYAAQIRGILKGGADAMRRGSAADLRILVPNVSDEGEVIAAKQAFQSVKSAVESEEKMPVPCKFGIMLETPRACVLADKLSPHVDFFTVGSNDLTQSTWALSKEDAEGKFLTAYMSRRIIASDPFRRFDAEGVGALMKLGIDKGRAANPKLEVILAGDAASDPKTMKLLASLGVDGVAAGVNSLQAVRAALDLSNTSSASK